MKRALRSASRGSAWTWGFIALLAALALAPVAARALAYPYLVSLAARAAILAAAAVSLQLVVGPAGLVSLGHAAFLGIGGYVALGLATAGLNEAALSVPAAIGAAAAFALGTGRLALRTRGVTFIMITLAFAQMAYFVAQSFEVLGGSDGAPLDPPLLFGTAVLSAPGVLNALALAVLAGLVFGVRVLAASRFGRVLRAATESEARVTASGFDIARARLGAYVLAGAGGGLAGWLFAVHAGFVGPAMLEWRLSGELLVMVILGGATRPEGAVAGAVAVVAAEEVLSGLTEHWRLIFGPLIIALVLLRGRRVWRRA
jgi:branched-chain amino acid transport system permease protein